MLARGQSSTEPIPPPWSPTASVQPQVHVANEPATPEVDVRYAPPANETGACKPVQVATRTHVYQIWYRVLRVPTLSLGGLHLAPEDALVTVRPARAGPTPEACGRQPQGSSHCRLLALTVWCLAPPLFCRPLLTSPPTHLHHLARRDGLGARNLLSAKFVCMGFAKNDPHATKMENHLVHIFCNLGSPCAPRRADSNGTRKTFHRRPWREISAFRVQL